MEKDIPSRIAICPNCGRVITYRTRGDKKGTTNYGNYPDEDIDLSGCLPLLLKLCLGILLIPALLLTLIFGSGFWSFLGGIFGFVFTLLGQLISLVFNVFGSLVGGLFDLIF